ncbi:MAG: hypothetical protein M1396_07060, partial [Chloroflexi bacterium]|nr:hypothetical protein [Chloroflexota bacterium]
RETSPRPFCTVAAIALIPAGEYFMPNNERLRSPRRSMKPFGGENLSAFAVSLPSPAKRLK